MKTTKLEKLNVCSGVIDYVKSQKSVISAWQNCKRGDWMLWLAKELNVDDKKLTMVKDMCDKQDALQACFDEVDGKIAREKLSAYAAAAHAAAATYAARIASLKKSADICRKYLTDDVLSKYRKLK
jgi:hypothetical protein